jgi:hypothetical protein
MSDELKRLLSLARSVPISTEEQERQRRSFAYGNTHFENDRITRAMIDEAASDLSAHGGKKD